MRLKELREERHLTQNDIAKEIKTSQIRKPARRASPFLSFRFTLFLRGLGARLRRPRAILYITNIYNNVCLTGAFFKLFWGSFFRRKFAF